MATQTYPDRFIAGGPGVHEARTARGGYEMGGRVFLWLAWAAACGLWALTMSSFVGILTALSGTQGGGSAWLPMAAGVAIFVAAIIWIAAHLASRDQRLNPVTEASTAALYEPAGRGVTADGAQAYSGTNAPQPVPGNPLAAPF